jgi:hypothetical protein
MSTHNLYDYLASLADAASTVSGDDFIILKAGVIQKLDQNKILSSLDITALSNATELAGVDTFLLQQGGTNKEIASSLIMPTGAIVPYGGITTPSGWIFCDGTAYSRTTYAPLYNAVTVSKGTFTVSSASPGVFTLNGHGLATGDCVELTTTGALYTGLSANTNYYVVYNDANTFWLSTSLANALAGTKINTSGSQSGTHSLRYCPWGISTSANFLVPDAREASFYGIGTRGTGVTAHDAKVFGQFADDQLQGHFHDFESTGNNAATNGTYISHGTSESGTLTDTNAGANDGIKGPITDGVNGTPRTGTVTRGKILGMKYIIKV